MVGGRRIAYRLLDDQSQRDAGRICFGRADVPEYAFEKAEVVFNFGADFLETSGNPVENARRFADFHAYDGKKKRELIHFSPHVSLTGAKADRWVMINPGSEAHVALALAHEIRKEKGNYGFLKEMLEQYSPESVEKAVGVPAAKLRELAMQFMKHSLGLALAGGQGEGIGRPGLAGDRHHRLRGQ